MRDGDALSCGVEAHRGASIGGWPPREGVGELWPADESDVGGAAEG